MILCFCMHGRLFKVPSEKWKCSVFFPNGFQLEWWGRPLNCFWLFWAVSQYVVWTSCRKWVLEEITCGNNCCIFLGNICKRYQLLQTDQDRLYLILKVLVNNTVFTLICTAHLLTIPLSIGITTQWLKPSFLGGFVLAKSKVKSRFNTMKVWACWWQKTSPVSLLSPSHSC